MDNSNVEVKKWRDRVYFPDEVFKPKTIERWGDDINRAIKESTERFTVIAAETESCVYKLGRYMVDMGLRNKSITFIDGAEIATYVDSECRYISQAKKMVGELFERYATIVHGRWVLVPYIDCPWTPSLAHMFIQSLRNNDAAGLLFYSPSDKPDGLAQVLCEETYIPVFQLPQERYKTKIQTHKMQKDEY